MKNKQLIYQVNVFAHIAQERELSNFEVLLYVQACRTLQTYYKLLDEIWEQQYNKMIAENGQATEYREHGPEDTGPDAGQPA